MNLSICKGTIKVGLLLVIIMIMSLPGQIIAQTQKFTVAWSIYAGWMPWDYAEYSDILQKWAETYNIEIKLVLMDYIPSIEAFTAKQVDACVMTNMDALTIPAVSGIDTTVLIVGDYSNGNDAILTRDGIGLANVAEHNIYLVTDSVSHYLLARALEMNGLAEVHDNLVNTPDNDIGPLFLADETRKVVVTWNPMVMEIAQTPGVSNIFSSADIPGEILDLMVVQTEVLKNNPDFGKALTGAWYEVMAIMAQGDAATEEALQFMAESSGDTLDAYKQQIATTAMLYMPQAAVEYIKSVEMKKKMGFVHQFCYEYGLLGKAATLSDVVGIQYPDGSIQGDDQNIKMRFNATYMELAAEGKLNN